VEAFALERRVDRAPGGATDSHPGKSFDDRAFVGPREPHDLPHKVLFVAHRASRYAR
jgi:hypothetical protein